MGRWVVRGALALALLGALAMIGRGTACDLMRLDLEAGRVRDVAICQGQPSLVEALARLQQVIPPDLLDGLGR